MLHVEPQEENHFASLVGLFSLPEQEKKKDHTDGTLNFVEPALPPFP